MFEHLGREDGERDGNGDASAGLSEHPRQTWHCRFYRMAIATVTSPPIMGPSIFKDG